MDKLHGIYFGTIDAVYPISHELNRGKYQYEYRVIITADLYSQLPVKCIRVDPNYGNFNGYDDQILEVGYRVFVQFPNGDPTVGLIVSGARFHPVPQTGTEGVYKRWRFGPIQMAVTAAGRWEVHVRPAANGPKFSNIYMDEDGVFIGDAGLLGEGQDFIKIDLKSRSITMNAASKFTINCRDADILAIGKVDLTCIDLDAKIAQTAKISALKLEARIATEAKIEVFGVADIKAQVIKLNGELGGVITTATQPTCYITGIPFKGSKTVKAGL